jgi:hypothetical protein
MILIKMYNNGKIFLGGNKYNIKVLLGVEPEEE